MAKQWKCARCSTKNDEGTLTCSNCRMIRGAVVVPGSFSAPSDPAPNAAPAGPAAPAVPAGPAAPAGPSAEPSSAWAAAAQREPEREPGSDAAEPTPSSWTPGVDPGSEPVAAKPLWRRIPIGGLIFVVLVAGGAIAGALFNASRSSTGEINRQGDMMATDLRVGDCFDIKDPTADELTDVTAKPCADEHEYELVYTGSLPEGDYPGEDAFDVFMTDNCIPAFNAYIGKAYADSVLEIGWLIPLEDAWTAGDRSIQCSVYHPDDARLIGSLKASNQ